MRLHLCNLTVAKMGKFLGLHTRMLNEFKGLDCKITTRGCLHPPPPQLLVLLEPTVNKIVNQNNIHFFFSFFSLSLSLTFSLTLSTLFSLNSLLSKTLLSQLSTCSMLVGFVWIFLWFFCGFLCIWYCRGCGVLLWWWGGRRGFVDRHGGGLTLLFVDQQLSMLWVDRRPWVFVC